MLTIGLSLAFLLAFAGWWRHRRGQWATAADVHRAGDAAAPAPVPAQPLRVPAEADFALLKLTNSVVAERLWKLAYAQPPPAPLGPAEMQVRDAILAALRADTLDPDWFPRRPALLPQLLRALDDPQAAPEKLARIITHDPVLAADVLRIANSSFYRTSTGPVETVQRAVVVCGVEALRGILATAMVRPVFRATRTNFPRLPRLLWERTERAARAAELHALARHPADRFDAQLAVLLSALGPLVVYSAALAVYAKHPDLMPNAALFLELTRTLGPLMAQRVAREWQSSPRLTTALEKGGHDSLANALYAGELLGTLSFLESQTVISADESRQLAADSGLDAGLVDDILPQLDTAT